jgi:hypothetical protein
MLHQEYVVMRKAYVGLLGLLACGLLVACQSNPKEPATEFEVRGTITGVHPQSAYPLDAWLDDLVFPESSPVSGLTGLILNVYPDTDILVKEQAGLLDGTVDDLTVGAVIEARTSTLLLLSDPPQSHAFEIVVDRTQ